MNVNILMLILLICATSLNGADSKKSFKIDYSTIKYTAEGFAEEDDLLFVAPTEGVIYLKKASALKNNCCKAHLITDKIYNICKYQIEDQVAEAEKLLQEFSEKDIQKYRWHHCTALICIGQAYSKFPALHDKAIDYLSKALNTYNFSGAAVKLATIRSYDNSNASLYYMQRAIDAGFKPQSSIYQIMDTLKIEEKEENLRAMQEVIEFEKDQESY